MPGARLLALADGMGGHAAGEVASQLVIATGPSRRRRARRGSSRQVESAVYQGNSDIAEQVELHPEPEGMGTTLTAILFAGDRLDWCTSATPGAICFGTGN